MKRRETQATLLAERDAAVACAASAARERESVTASLALARDDAAAQSSRLRDADRLAAELGAAHSRRVERLVWEKTRALSCFSNPRGPLLQRKKSLVCFLGLLFAVLAKTPPRGPKKQDTFLHVLLLLLLLLLLQKRHSFSAATRAELGEARAMARLSAEDAAASHRRAALFAPATPAAVAVSALAAQVDELERRAQRRQRDLDSAVQDAKATARLELSRVDSRFKEELAAKDAQLLRFRHELDALLHALKFEIDNRNKHQRPGSQENSNYAIIADLPY